MTLPPELADAVERLVAYADRDELSRAAAELSDAYRSRRSGSTPFMRTDPHRLAYLAVRLPATYAAVHAALAASADRLPEPPTTCLDLGAGPGTASWSAAQVWPSLGGFTLVERDPTLIALGREIATSGPPSLRNADWRTADLSEARSFSDHDLVVCGYAIGELASPAADRLVDAAWQVAGRLVVFVEPGTVPGFARIRRVRDRLISLGGHVVAPCPHADDCPMPANDWCHFSQRLDRTSLHRILKAGEMGHEDEKYAYVAVSREPADPVSARLLRQPQRRSGHAHLTLCTPTGIDRVTVTRSNKPDWKRLRRLRWGDPW